MARELNLQVRLAAIDKATRPIRAIMQGSEGMARQLKASRDALKGLQGQQRDVDSFRALQEASRATAEQLKSSNQRLGELGAKTAAVRQQLAPLQRMFQQSSQKLETFKDGNARLKGQLSATRNELGLAEDEWRAASRAIADYNTAQARGDRISAEHHAEMKALIATQVKRKEDIEALRNREKRLAGQYTESNRELKMLRDGHNSLRGEIYRIERPHKELLKDFKQAQSHSKRLGETYGKQERELKGLQSRLAESGVQTQRLGAEELRIKKNIDAATKAMQRQEAQLKAVAAQQKRLAGAKASYEKTQALAGSMAASGAAGVASGTGILYAGNRFMAPGLEFDSTMSKVQALTRLESGDEQLAALRAQARELGATTMFSAGDAASGMAFLAMAGFTPQAIRDAMPGLLDMAKAGDMDLGQTADIASNILGGFRLDASQMGSVADILTKAFTTSNMSLEMLGETMKYVGPVASTAGMGLEEAAAMAGLLGNVGIQGSQAGTTLRAMLLRLAAPAGPAAKAMAKLGVSAKDSQGNVRGITEVLGEVAKATEKMGSADRLAALKDIFGEEPAAGMAELISQSGAGGILKYLEALKDHQGAAAKTAKVMGDNMTGDMDELSSALDDLRIEVFDQMNGQLRDFTQAMTAAVGRIGAWVRENPELVKLLAKTTAGFGILLAVGGGLTMMLASILGPFAMVRYGMQMVGIRSLGLGSALLKLGRVALPLVGKGIMMIGRALLMNPIGLAITAIAVAGLAILKYWQPVKAFFSGFWQGLMDGMAPVQEALGPTFTSLGAALAPLKPIWEGITSALGAAWEWASKLFQPFQATSEELQSATESGRAFGLWLAGLINLVKELPGQMFDAGIEIANGLVNGITSKMAAVKDAITGAASSAIGWFKETLGIHSPSRVFAELGGHTMDGLQKGIVQGEGGPLAAVGDMSKRLAAAGAVSLSLAMGAAPAAADLPPDQVQTIRQVREAMPATQAPELQQQLQPVAIPAPADQLQSVRQVRETLPPEALPELVQQVRLQISNSPELEALQADQPIRFDSRPPLAAPASAPVVQVGGDTVEIHVHAAPGMDVQALTQAISAELDRRERGKAARIRSSLHDQE